MIFLMNIVLIKAFSQLHIIEALFHAQHWFCANINQLLWLSLR